MLFLLVDVWLDFAVLVSFFLTTKILTIPKALTLITFIRGMPKSVCLPHFSNEEEKKELRILPIKHAKRCVGIEDRGSSLRSHHPIIIVRTLSASSLTMMM